MPILGEMAQWCRAIRVYLCYRQSGGSDLAMAVTAKLRNREFRVFLDVDRPEVGPFPERLARTIEQTPCLIAILTKGSLDRCGNPEDWVRREFEHAVNANRGIAILKHAEFQYPNADSLVQSLRRLRDYQHVEYRHSSADSAIEMLEGMIKRFLPEESKVPIVDSHRTLDSLRFGRHEVEIGFQFAGRHVLRYDRVDHLLHNNEVKIRSMDRSFLTMSSTALHLRSHGNQETGEHGVLVSVESTTQLESGVA